MDCADRTLGAVPATHNKKMKKEKISRFWWIIENLSRTTWWVRGDELIQMEDTDVLDNLRKQLISSGFDHGARLRAEVLKSEYGCSASTVREVLFRLSTEGLVEFREQRGFRVPAKSRTLLNQLAHLRILLEQEGSTLSIRNGGVAWEARLTAAHHQLSHIEKRIHAAETLDPLTPLWFAAEEEFHDTLIDACGSDVLIDTHKRIYRQFRQQLMVADRDFGFISRNIQHHAEILQAALQGDEETTRAKIHAHLDRHLVAHDDTSVPAAIDAG